MKESNNRVYIYGVHRMILLCVCNVFHQNDDIKPMWSGNVETMHFALASQFMSFFSLYKMWSLLIFFCTYIIAALLVKEERCNKTIGSCLCEDIFPLLQVSKCYRNFKGFSTVGTITSIRCTLLPRCLLSTLTSRASDGCPFRSLEL